MKLEMNRRILIVDDEAEALRGYQDFLTPQKKGRQRVSTRAVGGPEGGSSPLSAPTEEYELFLASTGEEAFQIFKKEKEAGRTIAAGFFDVKLEGGGMDGIETIQTIKTMDPDIHCVVVTAYHDRSVDEMSLIFGEAFKDHWDYLNKPFTRGEIVQKARQMIAAWNRKKEIEAMHEQLVRAERLSAIGQVASGVGHEFGNILLRVMGKIDLALMAEPEEKVKNHLETALKAVERAGVIVRNLQSFSKTEAKVELTSLEAVIEDTISLMNHEFAKASIEIERKYEKTSLAQMDTRTIGQVFLNLFINATHAITGGGKITVTLKDLKDHEGSEWVFCQVADTGSGIPKSVLPHIFEYAYTTKGEQGSGLGLSISKKIVEEHHGIMSVESTPGKGTTFTVKLPKSQSL